MFLEVGGVPNVYLCGELGIAMDNNFIKVDKRQSTNVLGIYAAGDMTDNPLKQIITAAAEGAIAATGVYDYLKNSE
ncbi:FAD-dependent oxidoreductase, partial [Patescibacteria group bacterium]|nr:FAD-dependent oxidoreductase [Patescibacteria group bacterium]